MEDTIDTTLDQALETDSFVPETNAANPDGGAEKLTADEITPDIHESIDNLLDEAIRETGAETEEESGVSNSPDQPSNNQTNQTPSTETSGQSGSATDVGNSQGATQSGTAQDDLDPEIASIEPPRNISEKNQSNWRKLQETATQYKRQAAELETKIAELSTQQTQTQIPEDYQQLKEFRAIFELKNDQKFKERFDVPLAQAHENIYGLMKQHGATDELINSIKEKGGPEKIDQQWWKQNAIDKLPLVESEMLRKNLIDCFDINKRRKEEIEFAEKHASDLVAMKEAYDQELNQKSEQIAYDYADKVTQSNNADWARYKQIPQGATPDQIEKINKHNAGVEAYQDKYFSAYNAKTPEERAAVAAAAVLSHRLVGELEREQTVRMQLQEQIKKITDENNRLKGASKMPRQSVSTITQNKSNSLNERIKMNSSDAIDLGLDEAGE
jgi:hypothetical protein